MDNLLVSLIISLWDFGGAIEYIREPLDPLRPLDLPALAKPQRVNGFLAFIINVAQVLLWHEVCMGSTGLTGR